MMTPTMTGTQPALYTSRGKTIRPTGQENEKAFDLLNALDESHAQESHSELPSWRSGARARPQWRGD